MFDWSPLDLTIRQRERLERLHRRYAREPLPPDLPEILEEQLGIRLSVRFGALDLRHPLAVAPGEWTGSLERVEAAAEAGWAALTLRSAAAWAQDGSASLARLRSRDAGRGARSVYAPSDVRRERPAVLWDRKLDGRGPQEYLELVRAAASAAGGTMAVLASLASAPERSGAELPHAGELALRAGADGLEVLRAGGDAWRPAETADAGRWALRVIVADAQRLQGAGGEEAARALRAAPRLTLDFGTPAPGQPRTFRPGGLAAFLREWGLADCPVAAAGGVYSGRDALDYIVQGARMVQVYSYIAGRVGTVLKQSRNKFEQVLYRLMLDPRDGLAAGLAALKNRRGTDGVADAVGLAHKTQGDA